MVSGDELPMRFKANIPASVLPYPLACWWIYWKYWRSFDLSALLPGNIIGRCMGVPPAPNPGSASAINNDRRQAATAFFLGKTLLRYYVAKHRSSNDDGD